jgi:uncharacterized protein (DUF305 family)
MHTTERKTRRWSSLGPRPHTRRPRPAVAGPFDLQVLDTLSRHHAEAISMARLAETQAEHRELKEFARQLMRSQQAEIEQLRGWRNAWYANQPGAENPALPGMHSTAMPMEQLHTLKGAEFDRMFLQMMIPHHQGAVELARDILNRAEHTELKELAARLQAEQAREVEQLKSWQSSWFQ